MDFRYHAKTNEGKDIYAYRSAESESALLMWIRSNSWTPIDIALHEENAVSVPFKSNDENAYFSFFQRVKSSEKIVFFRQLAVMLSAGLPLASSLETLTSYTSSPRLKKTVSHLRERVVSGVPLSDALNECTGVVGTEAAVFIRPGEESGHLAESLESFADFLESRRVLRGKILSALTYPAAVIFIAAVIFFVMLTVVIPRFKEAFVRLGAPIPKLTLMTFGFGTFVKEHVFFLSLFVLLSAIVFMAFKNNLSVRKLKDKTLLKLPVFGDIFFKASSARGFKTASALLNAGVPISKALSIASEASLNVVIGAAFSSMSESVRLGLSMSREAAVMQIFPEPAVNMIAVGEESGRVSDMFAKLGEWYERELNEKIVMLTSVLEPAVVLFVGLLVALLVFSVFLPIISAINSLI